MFYILGGGIYFGVWAVMVVIRCNNSLLQSRADKANRVHYILQSPLILRGYRKFHRTIIVMHKINYGNFRTQSC